MRRILAVCRRVQKSQNGGLELNYKKRTEKRDSITGGIIHGRCGVALPAAYIANRNLECSEILELYFSLERRGCAGSNEKTWRQQKQLNIFVFAATDVIIALLVYERRGM